MPSFRNAILLTALVACQVRNSAAFIVPHGGKPNTKIARDMSSQQVPPGVDDIFQQYGEESRQYRRTVYTHEDWVRHRSSDRFSRNLSTFGQSSIYRSLFKEVTATTTVATLLVVWNMIFGEYQDLLSITHNGIMHDSLIPIFNLPMSPFTLSSPSLGLLLVFRTNTSYKRWDEARKNWGMNINHTRDLVRMGNAYYDRKARSPDVAAEDLDRLALATWAFVRSMKRHLSPEWDDEEAFQKELKEKLPAEQAQNILDAAHRPNRALQDLSTAIENLPMHFMRKNEIQAAATIFEDNLGSSERLLTSPIPVFYSRHTARFLSFWLLLLPFGLWGPLGNTWNHIGLIPTVSMLSIFLFGIEELATQLEEPFTILPMQAFCDKIYNWCKEIVSFKPGEDNGMPIYYYDNYKMDTDNVSMVTSDDGVPVYRFETDQPLQPEIEEIQAPDLYTVAYEAAMAAASAALAQTMGGGDVAAPPRAADPYAAMSAPAAAPVVHTPEPVAYTPPPVVAPEPVAYYTPPPVAAPEPVAYTPPPVAAPEPVAYTPPPVVAPEPVAYYTPPPVAAPEPVAYYTPPPAPAPEPVAYTPPPVPAPEPVAYTPPPVPAPEPVAYYTPPPAPAPEPVAYYTPPSVPAPEPVAYTPPPAAPSDPYTAQYNAAMPAAAEPAPASDSYTAQYDSAMAAASAPVGNPELLMELENAQTVTTETSVTTTTTSSNTGSYGTGTGAGGNYLDNLNRNNLS